MAWRIAALRYIHSPEKEKKKPKTSDHVFFVFFRLHLAAAVCRPTLDSRKQFTIEYILKKKGKIILNWKNFQEKNKELFFFYLSRVES